MCVLSINRRTDWRGIQEAHQVSGLGAPCRPCSLAFKSPRMSVISKTPAGPSCRATGTPESAERTSGRGRRERELRVREACAGYAWKCAESRTAPSPT
jgi:hypothetical protein